MDESEGEGEGRSEIDHTYILYIHIKTVARMKRFGYTFNNSLHVQYLFRLLSVMSYTSNAQYQ